MRASRSSPISTHRLLPPTGTHFRFAPLASFPAPSAPYHSLCSRCSSSSPSSPLSSLPSSLGPPRPPSVASPCVTTAVATPARRYAATVFRARTTSIMVRCPFWEPSALTSTTSSTTSALGVRRSSEAYLVTQTRSAATTTTITALLPSTASPSALICKGGEQASQAMVFVSTIA